MRGRRGRRRGHGARRHRPQVRQRGDGPARARVEVRPALQMERLFETACDLAEEGRTTKKGMPKPLELALFTREFKREVQGAFPPAFVQHASMAPLRWIADRRGKGERYAARARLADRLQRARRPRKVTTNATAASAAASPKPHCSPWVKASRASSSSWRGGRRERSLDHLTGIRPGQQGQHRVALLAVERQSRVGQAVVGAGGEHGRGQPQADRPAGDLEHVDEAAGQRGVRGVQRGDRRGRDGRVEQAHPDADHDHPGQQLEVARAALDHRDEERPTSGTASRPAARPGHRGARTGSRRRTTPRRTPPSSAAGRRRPRPASSPAPSA